MKNDLIDEETGFSMPSAKNFDVRKLFSLDNSTTLITGSAQGIGRVAAIACGKAGSKIAITDKDIKSAKLLEKELQEANINAKAWELDVNYEENILDTFSQVENELGSIDVLINNAGTANRSPN